MKKLTEKEVIYKFNLVHNNLYDYSKVRYLKMSSKVEIICKIHGSFNQTPNNHITKNHICPLCSKELKSIKLRKDVELLIQQMSKSHGNKYTYDLTGYKNNKSIISIFCKIHGEFKQQISSHLNGKCGCPLCKLSKGEISISKILTDRGIKFERQKTFDDLKYKRQLSFDFYLPDYNICIEYDGRQHYEQVFSEPLKNIQTRDNIKNQYCLDKEIILVRISYLNNDLEEIIYSICE